MNNIKENFVMSKKEKQKIAYKVYKTSDDYKQACLIADISPNTYYRWRIKFRSKGINRTIKEFGKWGYSKKPHNKTPDKISKHIEEIRRKYNYGTKKIAHIIKRDYGYSIHHDTVRKILKKKGFKTTLKKYPTRTKASWDRVIPFYPGDVVQVDPVQFGDIWIVNMQDSIIKWRNAIVVSQLKVENIKEKIKDGIAGFPFQIKNIQWDNGSETKKDFPKYLQEKYDINLRHTRPGSPWQNGMIERLNRVTRDEEFGISRYSKHDIKRISIILKENVRIYNEFRPHWSLGFKTPLEMWNACKNNAYLNSFVKIATV